MRRFAERERLPFAVVHDADGRVRWKRAGNVLGVLGTARTAIGAALR